MTTEDRKCRCGNCDWTGPESKIGKTLFECDGLAERLDAGSEVPVGECPRCECFAYYDKPAPILAVVVEGGVVQAIVTNDKDSLHHNVLLIDYDTEGTPDRETFAVTGSTDAHGAMSRAIGGHYAVDNADIDLPQIVRNIAAMERRMQKRHERKVESVTPSVPPAA